MSITLGFDEERVARLTVKGELMLDEAIASVSELYEDSRFTEPTRLLWDLQSARANWSDTEIDKFVDFIRKNRTQGRGRAAVVAIDDLSFGLSRIYEFKSYDVSVEVQVFRDLDDAIIWLKEEF